MHIMVEKRINKHHDWLIDTHRGDLLLASMQIYSSWYSLLPCDAKRTGFTFGNEAFKVKWVLNMLSDYSNQFANQKPNKQNQDNILAVKQAPWINHWLLSTLFSSLVVQFFHPLRAILRISTSIQGGIVNLLRRWEEHGINILVTRSWDCRQASGVRLSSIVFLSSEI
jgi:hypothetical protein